MDHDINQHRIDACLHRSARLRSQAFTAMFGRLGRGIWHVAGTIAAIVT